MANDASVTVQATVLPDEIASVISGSMTVTPADANDKWYYKKTDVQTTTADLIAGNYIDYDGVNTGTGMTAIVPAEDTVKFLFVKNTDANNAIYISLNGAATKAATEIKLAAGHSIALSPNSTLVENLDAISDTAEVTCIVAALIDDTA